MRTEEDIRAALRTLAREAPDADAVLGTVRDKLARVSTDVPQDGRRNIRRWLAPLAAAAVVTAVIATAVAIAGMQSPRHRATPDAALDKLPRYYLTMLLPAHAKSNLDWTSVVVKNTRTGATLLTARPPAPYTSFAGVAGAADDRTFVLAAQVPAGPPRLDRYNVKLFRARLDPSKRTLTMTPLPIPVFTPPTQVNTMALSANGSEVAVAMETGKYQKMFVVSLYSLAGKVLRSWHSRGMINANWWYSPDSMSWARTGVLAINWTFYRLDQPMRSYGGVWLLNTGSPSGSLVAQSRRVVQQRRSGYFPGDGVLSASGETIAVPMVKQITGTTTLHGRKVYVFSRKGEIQVVSAATGQLIRTLWPVDFGGKDAPVYVTSGEIVMWTNAAGSVMVVEAPLARGRSDGQEGIGVLSGKRFTPIPGAPIVKAGFSFGPFGLVF
jgi:hypothetical protein